MTRPVSVVHVISGLRLGGAETALLRLVEAADPARWRHAVVSLGPRGPMAEPLEQAGVAVSALGLTRSWAGPLAARALVRTVRGAAPDLVVGWMYHGNLGAWWAARRIAVPAVWNVRHTLGTRKQTKRTTALIARLGGRLASRAAAVVFNSSQSAARHGALGYPSATSRVVPNGIDCDRFAPQPSARARLRRSLGWPADALVVGRVGRNHPIKDHPGFLEAAARAGDEHPGLHAVAAGPGVDTDDRLHRQATDSLGARSRLVGAVDDMPGWLAGLDVLVSSSRDESFPNVVAEAMACGVPCVVTDVGASAEIVDTTGIVVPAGDPGRLGKAIADLAAETPSQRTARGRAARARIEARFSARRSRAAHEKIWRDAIRSAARPTTPSSDIT